MKLVGANDRPKVSGADKLPGIVNYFIGNDPEKWRTNIPTYKKVEYENVYPGIDLAYYGNQGQLEYDLIVAPGVDPDQIKLSFQGAEDLSINEEGNLVLSVAGGEVLLLKPYVYQTVNGQQTEIAANYVLLASSPSPLASRISLAPFGGEGQGEGAQTNSTPLAPLPAEALAKVGHEVRIALASYDTTQPLIIDPVISYSSYLGGSSDDAATSLALDTNGNMYLAGLTGSADFPTSATPFQGTFAGGSGPDPTFGEVFGDIFVVKLSPDGTTVLYATYLGGSQNERNPAIAVDASGQAVVYGTTRSQDFPILNAFQPAFGGGPRDVFVTKLNAAGSALVFSSYHGGTGDEFQGGLALDGLGNVYIDGSTTSSVDFPLVNPLQAVYGGGSFDGFVTKVNVAGTALVYSTYLGGNDSDLAKGVAVDASGQVHLIGDTKSLNFPTHNAFQPTYGGGSLDGIVAKLNASGDAFIYSTYLGGSGRDLLVGLGSPTLDPAGNLYVTGGTTSVDFPTVNALQPIFGGNDPGHFAGFTFGDAVLFKVDPNGTVVFSSFLGGSGVEVIGPITLDAAGNVYLGGATSSLNFPVVNPIQPVYGGGGGQNFDAVLVQLNPALDTIVFSTYVGGSLDEQILDIAVTAQGELVAIGATDSLNFPVTTNALQPAFGGGTGVPRVGDSFILKVSPIPLAPEGLQASDVPNDQGGAIDLTWTFITSLGVTEQRLFSGTDQGGPYSLLATLSSTATSFTDMGLIPGQTYYYVIRAFDGIQQGPNSNEASAVPVDNIDDPPNADTQGVVVTEDTETQITLTGDDGDEGLQPLTFALTSLPGAGTLAETSGGGAASIGPLADPVLFYTPAQDSVAPASFTFTVNDGTFTSTSATVNLSITPVNDAPSFDDVLNQAVATDSPAQNVSITGVIAGPADETETVAVTAISSNLGLIPNPVVTGIGASRTLTYQPNTGQTGTTTITVTADDGQASPNTFARIFTITVGNVVTNSLDPRILTTLGATTANVTLDGGAVVFSGTADAVQDVTPPLIAGATYVLSGVNGGGTVATSRFRADGDCALTIVP